MLTAAAITVALVGIWLVAGAGAIGPSIDAFFSGVAGDRYAISATARAMVPVLLCGLGAWIAFRAGLFDVGQPAQLVVGAMVAGAVAPWVPGPGPFVMAVSLAAGAAGAAVWGYLVAGLSAIAQIELIIVSLIANYLVDGLSQLLTATVLHDPASVGIFQMRAVPTAAELPELVPRTGLHAGVVIMVAVWLVACYAVVGSVWGHRLRLFGLNPRFAELSGTSGDRFRRRTLALAASFSGLAGAIQVLGVFGRYQNGTLGGGSSPAWFGLTLALLVPGTVVGLIGGALLLAGLQTGFAGVQRDVGVTGDLALVIQSVILIAASFGGRTAVTRNRRHRLRPAANPGTDPSVAQLERQTT